jgi:hypothetical protein
VKTLLLVSLSAVSLGAAAAGPAPRAASTTDSFAQDRAACDSNTVEDRAACRREAGAARVEARRGTLAQENTDFDRNRMARCDVHKNAEERAYCERRMRGEGTTTGSVEGGGILRELIVVVPVEETPVTPAR